MSQDLQERLRLISLATAADYFGCSTDTVRRMVSRGELQAFRVGRRALRVDEREVLASIRRVPTA